MILRDLLSAGDVLRDGAEVAAAAATIDVRAVTYDSRQAVPGSIFVALQGVHADGGSFVRDAVARGAVAVVSEAAAPENAAVAWIRVPDARLALAGLAAALYGNPSEELTLVGITGTNGKTTTSYLLESIFDAAGVRCGRIGTVGYRVGDQEIDAPRTTPEAPELHGMLREMVTQGCGACVMEVSSHALALRRTDHLRFAAAIFTNLTRDHLDFHRDMEDYFRAKRRLFELLPDSGVAITNVDDRRGAEIVAAARRPVTYAIDAPADVRPGPLALSLDGLSFEARTPRGTLRLNSRLVGRPNAYNILAATAAAMALDVPFSAIEEGIRRLDAVPGRFQVVSDPADDVKVVVDYAHTDDALKNLLETARTLSPGRLITVFGCGGDRDRPKRPLMGAVAARLSDLVIVTSDNPRSEDPEQIIDEIKRGIVMPADRQPADRQPPKGASAASGSTRNGPPASVASGSPRNGQPASVASGFSRTGQSAPRSTPYLAVTDRKAAIERAVRDARAGDLVLIAGKGHEKYQVIGDRVLPFDDVEVARGALARRRAGSRVS